VLAQLDRIETEIRTLQGRLTRMELTVMTAIDDLKADLTAFFTAFDAFERALALSPSSSFALLFGSVALAWSAEAERAIDWAERGLRVSPRDQLNYMSYHALAVSHFLRGRYEEAANAARRAIQYNPGFSISHALLVAPLAKLGRVDEARAAVAQVLALQPSFSVSGFCAAIALPTTLAGPLAEAWREAGLPS